MFDLYSQATDIVCLAAGQEQSGFQADAEGQLPLAAQYYLSAAKNLETAVGLIDPQDEDKAALEVHVLALRQRADSFMKGESRLPVNQEIFPVALKHLCNPAYLESIQGLPAPTKIQTEEPTQASTTLPWTAEELSQELSDSPLPALAPAPNSPLPPVAVTNSPVKGAKTATVLGAIAGGLVGGPVGGLVLGGLSNYAAKHPEKVKNKIKGFCSAAN